MNQPYSIKRVLLFTVVGGLVLTALLGIYALLFGKFGETECKILLTTLGISYFSVTSLACAAAFEKKRYFVLAIPGLVLAIAGFALFLPGVWADWWLSHAVVKTTAILAILSFSFAHACLLSFATLQRQFAWVYYAAVGTILGLAALISGIIIEEPRGDWVWRITGAVAIVDCCLTICIPILHWLGRSVDVPATTKAYEQIELVCPRCGKRETYAIGSIRCRHCSLAIEVRIKEMPVVEPVAANSRPVLQQQSPTQPLAR